MGGSVKMVEETLKLAYGENSEFIKDKRIAAVQSLFGTGACRLFADFQKRFRPNSQIYIPVLRHQQSFIKNFHSCDVMHMCSTFNVRAATYRHTFS